MSKNLPNLPDLPSEVVDAIDRFVDHLLGEETRSTSMRLRPTSGRRLRNSSRSLLQRFSATMSTPRSTSRTGRTTRSSKRSASSRFQAASACARRRPSGPRGRRHFAS